MTAAQIDSLKLSARTGKPYIRKNYRHNARQWEMWQRMIADGLLTDILTITPKGHEALKTALKGI